MNKLKNLITSIFKFITDDIWNVNLKTLPKRRAFFIRQLRIIVLGVKGFRQDKIQLRASALTFYSMLSVVPVLAMAFGIAQGFGLEKLLEKQITAAMEGFDGEDMILDKILTFTHSLLSTTKGGAIAGVGFVLLLYSVIRLLENIEISFNDIWGVKKARGWIRQLTDFLTLMIISPILIVLSSSATVYVTTQISQITQSLEILHSVRPYILMTFHLVPYILIWLLFTILYQIMPNTKVKFSSALVGGIIAGTFFQLLQWGYITFQYGVSRYNAIYGSFAALPLFIVWMQFSWLIILMGAKVAFANQNVDRFEFIAETEQMSISFKRLLALSVSHIIIKRFVKGEAPLTLIDITKRLEAPAKFVKQIINDLMEARIIVEIKTNLEKESPYQPAQDPNKLTVKYILNAIESHGFTTSDLSDAEEVKVLAQSLDEFDSIISKSQSNLLLREL